MYKHMVTTSYIAVIAGVLGASAVAQEFNTQPAARTHGALSGAPGVERSALDGFYPSLSVSISRQEDALRDPDDDESDTVVRVSPGLSYKTKFGSANEFQARYTANFEEFNNFDNLDGISNAVDLGVALSPSNKLVFDIYGAHFDSEEERGSSASRLTDLADEEDEFDKTTVGGRVTFGRKTNTIQLVGGVETSDLEYTNNDQSGRDRDADTILGKVIYNLGPKTALNLTASQLDTDYDASESNRDSETTNVSIGIDWQPTYITSLSFAIGDEEKDMDDPTLEDFDGTTYLGRLNWNPRERTRVSLYASRKTEESSEIDSSFFVSRLVGISLGQALTNRINLSIFANNTEDEFSGGREDDIDDYGASVSYAVTNWLRAGLKYGKTSRSSTDPDAEYDDGVISLLLGLNWEKTF